MRTLSYLHIVEPGDLMANPLYQSIKLRGSQHGTFCVPGSTDEPLLHHQV